MKKIVTTLLIVFSFTLCNAQWVTIPDVNFRNWLNANGYSSCMNGTMMDTTCSAVVNATSVYCNSSNIYDLNGIQYFNMLTILGCQNNPITSLPTLPNSLIQLYCQNCQLSGFPPPTAKFLIYPMV